MSEHLARAYLDSIQRVSDENVAYSSEPASDEAFHQAGLFGGALFISCLLHDPVLFRFFLSLQITQPKARSLSFALIIKLYTFRILFLKFCERKF